MTPLYTVGKILVGNFMMLGWRPTVEGLEHVPASGGAILAGNHLSVSDELFLGSVIKRQVHFWAKEDYFHMSGVKGALFGSIMRGLGAIPVHREGGRAALHALDAAIPVLRSGELVGIFPEGTRSADGKLHRGRTGVARLAVEAGVPVVPVGFIGTKEVQPIGVRIPRLGKGEVVIRFGPALDFSTRANDRSAMRGITDEIMQEIGKLTGQEYTGRYAPRRKSEED